MDSWDDGQCMHGKPRGSGCEKYPCGDSRPVHPWMMKPMTDEQAAEFQASLAATLGDGAWKHKIVVLPAAQPDIDTAAAAFAQQYGSFSLHFDVTQNYAQSDHCPWSLILDGDEEKGWGGFTAQEAMEFAASELKPEVADE